MLPTCPNTGTHITHRSLTEYDRLYVSDAPVIYGDIKAFLRYLINNK
jgi:hypothetical protein